MARFNRIPLDLTGKMRTGGQSPLASVKDKRHNRGVYGHILYTTTSIVPDTLPLGLLLWRGVGAVREPPLLLTIDS